MKKCPRCQEFKALSEFGNNRTRPDGLQVQCRPCLKQIQHDWYQRHKTVHYKNILQRRRAKSAEILEHIGDYFKTHPCVDCGESDPVVLDFDHVRGEKCFSIGTRWSQGYSWEYLLHEIEKCEVRC